MTLPALDGLRTALDVLRAVPRSGFAQATDADLLEVARIVAEVARVSDAHAALAAGVMAERSRPELGAAGLARREGARTVEELLTTTMQVTGRDAATAVRVGRLTRDPGAFAGLGDGVTDGSLSTAAVDAIASGLGEPDGVDASVLDAAIGALREAARELDPDRLRKRAREVRDEIDAEGVADREAALRGRRSLRRIDLRDGMKRLVWTYDPETAGIVDEVYDRATSPRQGGPRFVDPEQAARASGLADDPRSTEQLASDAFAELLRQAASADPEVLVGSGAPGVRILVDEQVLATGRGYGVIEGSHESVSLATVDRVACTSGVERVTLDGSGRVLDHGRSRRLFSSAQRAALAVRDGGCLWPGCDRPPSWCEAHHIDHWSRGGRTDLDRGVLLCRHHHLRLHNEQWSIVARAGKYWLEPPPGSGRMGALLVTKSRAVREFRARRAVEATPGSGSGELRAPGVRAASVRPPGVRVPDLRVPGEGRSRAAEGSAAEGSGDQSPRLAPAFSIP